MKINTKLISVYLLNKKTTNIFCLTDRAENIKQSADKIEVKTILIDGTVKTESFDRNDFDIVSIG